MTPEGIASHVLLDLEGVDPALLDDLQALEAALRGAAAAARCQVLGSLTHRFQPHGASVVLLLAESHLAIHTWPEHAFACADILTCGATLPQVGVESLVAALRPARCQLRRVDRGQSLPLRIPA